MSGRRRGHGRYGGSGGRGQGQGVGQPSPSHSHGRGAGGRRNEQAYIQRAPAPPVAFQPQTVIQQRPIQDVPAGQGRGGTQPFPPVGVGARGNEGTSGYRPAVPSIASSSTALAPPARSFLPVGVCARGNGGTSGYRTSVPSSSTAPQPPTRSFQPVGVGARGNEGTSGYRPSVPYVASSSTAPPPPTRELKNLSLGSPAPEPVRTVTSGPVHQQTPIQESTVLPQLDAAIPTQQSAAGSTPHALSLVPSPSKLHKAPARPGYGTIGKKCMITANHFLVDLGDKDPYQYDVTITPEVTSKTKCREIMKHLTEEYRASHMGNRRLAYDGKKSAFAAGPLPFESKEFVLTVPEKNGREREFKVTVKFAAQKDIHHLRQFLSGRQRDNPHETIQALDVVLRETASNDREIIGRSIFSATFGKGSIGNGIDYWRGFYQSLRPTQMGLSLNIDMSARAFYDTMLVSDFVSEFLGKDLTRPLSDQDRIKLRKGLRGVKVEVCRVGYKRTYKVQTISMQPIRQLTFPVDENGTNISVVQYFRDKYNFNIQFPFLPALQAGTDAKPAYLPMEICRLVDRQRYSKKLNERQVAAMLKATCRRPKDRQEEILGVIRGNNFSSDKIVKDEFGMEIREQLTTIQARVLPPPPLKYHRSGRRSEVQPAVGQWNMINLKMVDGGTVNYWAIINFSRQSEDAVYKFCDEIVSMCQAKGMEFNRQPLIPMTFGSPQNVERALVQVHTQSSAQLKRVAPGQLVVLQLLFVILPETTGSSYGKIKRVCETELGIVSQCCQPKHVMKNSKQYFENVSLKVNVKVGGRNNVLSAAINNQLPIISEHPTIIFGADVTHPQSGEDSTPSIAAVVASMDWPQVTKYRALVSAQPHRQEIIEDLYTTSTDAQRGLIHKGLIREHLIAFRNSTGYKPSRIIFYRDGVSEGQFSHVLLHEMDKIRKACVSLEENYLPRVTFIVVQKRHHTRLFPVNHGDRATTDRSGNILPGTVVDTNICHPTEFDFYLCSHAGIQGTSRPAHYHVLYDENKFTADGLQMLTNSLCYTCTRSVSIVPPAYYAHLTAFRARYYMEGTESDSESSAAGGRATRDRIAEVRPLPKIIDHVKDVMFYC